MDVRCERCNSEYEFDEARVPDAGLSVKCSTCGHVFRVFKAGPPAAAEVSALPDGSGGEWMIRQTNGNVFNFKELTTLQRWIVERKVSRDDEISRSGRQWKRLGNIAELATFFQVVEAQAAPAPQPQPIASQTTPVGWGAGPQPQVPVSSAAPQQPVAGPFSPSSGAAWEQNPQAPAWNQQSGNWQMPSGQPSAPTPNQNANIDLASFPSSALDDDEFEVRRGGIGKWIVILLVLAGIGGGVAYVVKPELFKRFIGPKVNEQALAHVKTGYELLYRDSYGAIDEAIENFDKAISFDGEYADARAGLAEAELARAENIKEEADALAKTLEGKPEEQKTIAAEVEALRSKVSERSEKAFNAAKGALEIAPEALAPNRAMADYYRFKNDADQMRTLIERARAAEPKDPGVAYVLGSSVAGDMAAAERAIRYFDEALEGQPAMNRARYKLARVYQAQEDREKAMLQIETILKAEPEHERAKALQLELEPPPPPKPAEPEPEPESELEKKTLTYEQLLNKAERLRQADRAGQALSLYERASEMEPTDAEGYIGLGFCYIDLENSGAAISSFNQALRYAPRMSDAQIGLAEAYRMKGDKVNAIKHYKRYLDIMPTGPEAPVARRMIKMLEK